MVRQVCCVRASSVQTGRKEEVGNYSLGVKVNHGDEGESEWEGTGLILKLESFSCKTRHDQLEREAMIGSGLAWIRTGDPVAGGLGLINDSDDVSRGPGPSKTTQTPLKDHPHDARVHYVFPHSGPRLFSITLSFPLSLLINKVLGLGMALMEAKANRLSAELERCPASEKVNSRTTPHRCPSPRMSQHWLSLTLSVLPMAGSRCQISPMVEEAHRGMGDIAPARQHHCPGPVWDLTPAALDWGSFQGSYDGLIWAIAALDPKRHRALRELAARCFVPTTTPI